MFDMDHSATEDRWVTMGIAANGTLLVVHHTFEHTDASETRIRVFSARKATRRETVAYQGV